MNNIKADFTGLAEELQEYADDVVEKVDQDAQKIANSAASELRATSPKRTGGYANGWRVQKEKSRYGTSCTVYNAWKPGLTQLLENGHALRGGGRAPAHPHIKPVEEKVISDFENAVRRNAGDV